MHLTILSSTNRPNSMTRRVSGFVEKLIQENIGDTDTVKILDLQDLPPEIFIPHVYEDKPKSFEPMANEIINTDGIMTVMPEYNGGAPGILKYFIDMLPFPQSLAKKPIGFVGLSAGRFGAIRSVEQIMQICAYRNAYIYPERVFLNFINKAVDEEGKPTDPDTLKLLESEIKGFVEFARRFS